VAGMFGEMKSNYLVKKFIGWLFWWSTEEAFDNGMMAGAEIGIRFERDRIKQLILENSFQHLDSEGNLVFDEVFLTATDLINLLDKDQVF
jgi:hypothetical protein